MKKNAIRTIISIPLSLILIPSLFGIAITVRVMRRHRLRPSIVWGTDPLLNYKYWSRAMKQAGYESTSIVTDIFAISSTTDFDVIIADRLASTYNHFQKLLFLLRLILVYIRCLIKFDVFVFSCNGFLLSKTGIFGLNYKFENLILKISRKKSVVIPFGADAYVYRRVKSIGALQGLMQTYPEQARKQPEIAKRVDYWVSNADVFLPSGMSLDGFGRWDCVTPNLLCIDTEEVTPKNLAVARKKDSIVITHSPHHRGVKGTIFIQAAVDKLVSEGHSITLKIVEGVTNKEVLRILREESDIHIDQILLSGYGLNAIEAMASGVPVVGRMDSDFMDFFGTWSYLDECPIQTATPKTIYDVIKSLILSDDLRNTLSTQGVEYVQKHHSYASFSLLLTKFL